MKLEYIGLSEMAGSLIFLDGVSGIGYDEMAEISLPGGEKRYGRVIQLDGSRAVLQVFEGVVEVHLRYPNGSLSKEGRTFGKGTTVSIWGDSSTSDYDFVEDLLPWSDKLPEEVKQDWYKKIPLRRGGTPEDIANVCLFLASDMSSYVSGQVIQVCGGMMM